MGPMSAQDTEGWGTRFPPTGSSQAAGTQAAGRKLPSVASNGAGWETGSPLSTDEAEPDSDSWAGSGQAVQ